MLPNFALKLFKNMRKELDVRNSMKTLRLSVRNPSQQGLESRNVNKNHMTCHVTIAFEFEMKVLCILYVNLRVQGIYDYHRAERKPKIINNKSGINTERMTSPNSPLSRIRCTVGRIKTSKYNNLFMHTFQFLTNASVLGLDQGRPRDVIACFRILTF